MKKQVLQPLLLITLLQAGCEQSDTELDQSSLQDLAIDQKDMSNTIVPPMAPPPEDFEIIAPMIPPMPPPMPPPQEDYAIPPMPPPQEDYAIPPMPPPQEDYAIPPMPPPPMPPPMPPPLEDFGIEVSDMGPIPPMPPPPPPPEPGAK